MESDKKNDGINYVYNMVTGCVDQLHNVNELEDGARELNNIYKALVAGGFTQNEALKIVIGILAAIVRK